MRPHISTIDRICCTFVVVLLVSIGLTGPGTAEQRAYTMDNDPLRLGNKALEAGRLDDARSNFEDAVAHDHHLIEALCGLARIDLLQGLYTDAEAHYRQALAAGGGRHAEARAGLGLIQLRRGDDQAAALEFNKALEQDKKAWDAHYGLALLALRADDWATAEAHLEYGRELKGRQNGQDKYQHGLALYLLGTGDTGGAERAAMLAQVLNPTEPQYAQFLARIHQDQGRTSMAISAYEQALATPAMTPTAPMLHELGQLYAQENRFNDASARYLQAVSVDSTYAPAIKDLAELFLRAQRHDKAAGTYLRYVALAPEDGPAQLKLCECLCELGRFDEAATAAHIALRQTPDDPIAQFQFGHAGIQAHDDSLAAEAAALMAAHPNDVPWLVSDLLELAEWQSAAKDHNSASETLGRAAVLAPEDDRIAFKQGIAELMAGRATPSVDHFERAVTLNSDAAIYHLNLGIARYQAGRLSEAEPAFRRAVELRPELTTARLLLAQVLATNGALIDAESEYRAVLAKEPQNAKALRGVGFCCIRSADYPGAQIAYTEATKADPANADGWAGLGNALLGQGNLAGAESAFTKAQAIDPQNVMLKTGTELLNQAKSSGKENE